MAFQLSLERESLARRVGCLWKTRHSRQQEQQGEGQKQERPFGEVEELQGLYVEHRLREWRLDLQRILGSS